MFAKFAIFSHIFLGSWFAIHQVSGVDEKDITKVLERILDKETYEKNSIPLKDGKPLPTSLQILINDMVPREQAVMHFSMDFFLLITWTDYRLKFELPNTNETTIPFDYKILKEIWVPNLYFKEAKGGEVVDIPQPNIMVTISTDGKVTMDFKILSNYFCSMDMGLYPFDKQNCNLSIESYSYGSKYVNLSWSQSSILHLSEKELKAQDFSKIEIKLLSKITNYPVLGEWDSLILQFTFYRDASLYIIRDFLPVTLIVVLSWVNFWINFRSTPARVALGITTVLTIVTMTNNVRKNSPNITTGLFRSIDVYMLVCNMFVVAALCEGALVGMSAPNERQVKNTFKNQVKKIIEKSHRNKKPTMQNVVANKILSTAALTTTAKDALHEKNKSDGGEIGQGLAGLRQRKGTETGIVAEEIEEKEVEEEITSTIIQRVRPITTETFKWGPFYFYKDETHIVDRFSRILFPFCFLAFVFTFFIVHHLDENSVL